MNEWLRTLALSLGVDPLEQDHVVEVLGVARDVAHEVERKATPLATFLLGAAVQRRIGHGSTYGEAFEDAVADLRTQLGGSPEG